jgi:hypothetical protein
MIELGDGTGFAGRAEILVVPIGDDDLAIGVEAGTRRSTTLSRTLRVAGDSSVARRWTGSTTICDADLGGVDGVGDEYDGLALAKIWSRSASVGALGWK